MTIPLSDKQKDVVKSSDSRVNLLEGSIRSGKTFTSFIRWLTFIANDAPKQGALIMVGKSRDSIFRNIFEPVENDPTLAPFQAYISYRQGAPTAVILGRIVHVIGAADAKAESKIRGMTVAGAYVDELTTIPKEFFKQLLGRMSVTGAKMFATTNPDSPNHWLRQEYLLRAGDLPDWKFWHFTMEDNPGLPEAYRASLEREYSGLWYRRFILGEWVAAEGAVYDGFDSDVHVVDRKHFPPMKRILMAGLDYGVTHRTRAYLIGLADTRYDAQGRFTLDDDAPTKKPALYVLSEFAPDTATVGQHAAMFRAWLANQPEAWRNPEWIAVDPAAAVFKQQLFNDGITNVMNAHNAVLPGIQTVASLLAVNALFIANDCEKLISGFPAYRWDSAATARGETRPIKEDDDEVDALRYAIYTSRRFWRDSITLSPALNNTKFEDTTDGAS